MKEVLRDDCLSCPFYNVDGTCGNRRCEMYGVVTNGREVQSCACRQYYTREASRRYRRKRKIETI